MKKLKIIIATLSAFMYLTVPVYADSTKVVTIGADLSETQKSAIIKYFGVNTNEDKVICVTNKDVRDYLSSYVLPEKIGNYAYSCAYVIPKITGGIQVKTSNLSWVSGNMIAATLATYGVTNCQVIAASPFPVSGTSALTGVIMAYENVNGKQLDNVKKELANKELIITGKLANDVGQSTAIAIVNEAKMDVVEKNITNIEEIKNIVNKVTNEYNTSINRDQMEEISGLLEAIAKQKYDIEQMKKTLEQIQANVVKYTPASPKKIDEIIAKAEKSKEEKAENETTMLDTNKPAFEITISSNVGVPSKDEA